MHAHGQVKYGEPEGCGGPKEAEWCPMTHINFDWMTTKSFNWNRDQSINAHEYFLPAPQVYAEANSLS